MTFPDDENGDVLRRLQRDGDDLTQPRDIDFTVIFPGQFEAEAFANHFRCLGYEVSVEETKAKPEAPWDVLVVKNMIPSHAGITGFEALLQNVASGFGGRNDGWGCFAQKQNDRGGPN